MNPFDTAAFQHNDWASHPVEQIGEGIQRQMIWGERLMVCRLSFAPRIVTAVHSHPHEQITIVERGRVRFTVAGEERIASAGDVLFFPSGLVLYWLINNSLQIAQQWHVNRMLQKEAAATAARRR